MDINQAFPSKYIKAADLKGRDVIVVIASAEIETIGDDRKLVLAFQGKEKTLVCNRTNALTVAELYGNDTDSWLGREVVLFATKVPFQGKLTDAIRVKAPPRRPAQNGGKPELKHVVEQRSGYQLSSMRPKDGIEEATGARTRDPADDEIPF